MVSDYASFLRLAQFPPLVSPFDNISIKPMADVRYASARHVGKQLSHASNQVFGANRPFSYAEKGERHTCGSRMFNSNPNPVRPNPIWFTGTVGRWNPGRAAS